MSYEPLHHKYRPQTFASLVGQEAIATTLTNAIRTERIAPAYLFTGPRGTGKTSSARILAKSLNCKKQTKPTEQPCGVCEVCKSIASGTALDVIEIDAASNTGVDNIREIIERAQFAPVQCRYKVYVIDECHMLSGAAFNSLLKTLEEPPNRVVFVLATTDPQRVLPTIISRCQRFDFRRIPLPAMVSHLQDIPSKEGILITDEAITLVAQVAQGGLRDAESLLDQLSLLAGEVTVERVWDLVGAVPEQDLLALTEAIASNNPEAVLEKARHLMDRGREPLIVLQNLAGFYRDLLIAKTAPARNDLVAITASTWSAMCEFAKNLNPNTLLIGQKHLKDSEIQIKNTTQPRLWLEVTLLGLLQSATTQPVSESPALQQSRNGSATSKTQPAPTQQSLRPTSPTRNTTPANTAPTQLSAPTETAKVPPTPREPEPPVSRPSNPQPPVHASTMAPDPTVVASAPDTDKSQTQPSLAAQNSTTNPSSDLDEIWQQVLAQLKPVSTRELLRQLGRLIDLDHQYARVSIPQAWRDKIQEKLSNIEAAFQDALNYPVKVSLQARATDAFDSAPAKQPTPQGKLIEPSQQAATPSATNLSSPPARQVPSDESQQLSQRNQEKAIFAPPSLNSETASDRVLQKNGTVTRENLSVAPTEVSELARQETTQAQSHSQLDIESDGVGTLIAQNLDTDTEGVEKALASLQQFFEGEIVDLADDFILNEPLLTNQPQDSSFVAATTRSPNTTVIPETLEPDLEEELDSTAMTHLPTSETTFSNPTQRLLEADDWQDDEDIPFRQPIRSRIRDAHLQDAWELAANQPGIWLLGNRSFNRFS